MPHNIAHMSEHEELDLNSIRRYEVDFDTLTRAASEDEFLRVSFELLRESTQLLVAVAGTLDQDHVEGFTRNEAILVGHLIRMSKLMRAVIAGIADEHGGDQQMQLTRQFLDSASIIKYLLQDKTDVSRFDAYVFDSLVGEKEFMKNIREQIALRGGEKWDIEERMERSVQQTFMSAGVTEDEIPSRKKINWPNAQTRLALLGPAAYSAYRIGSGMIHGSWYDIERHHLERVDGNDGNFFPYTDPMPERPQPLFSMALLAVLVAQEYVFECIPEAVALYEGRFTDLIERLDRADGLHEAYLVRRSKVRRGAS